MNAFSNAAAGGLVRITLPALVAGSVGAASLASRAERGLVDVPRGRAT